MNKIVGAAPDLDINIPDTFVSIYVNYLVFLYTRLTGLLEFIFQNFIDS